MKTTRPETDRIRPSRHRRWLAPLASWLLATSFGLLHAEPPTTSQEKSATEESEDASTDAPAEATNPAEPSAKAEADKQPPWRSLFNGRDLTNWKSTNFGGEGDVTVKDKAIHLAMGNSLTGITWSPNSDAEALPTVNYEVELQARRVQGDDFFCGLTFPYKDTHASLILGGWGGGLTGISCINHYDASENDTTGYHDFKRNQWYHVRLRVTDGKFEAWIDGKSYVDVALGNATISVRNEVEPSRPLGVASFITASEIRGIRIRSIPPKEKSPPEESPTDDS